MSDVGKVEMAGARDVLKDLDELCVWLDGKHRVPPEVEPNSKARAAKNAEISRTLLHAAHLADVVRVEIMNQYQTFKGEERVPRIQP